MKIVVVRRWLGDTASVGKLFINGRFFCYTLEDQVRPIGEKVSGHTAIPYGTYPVRITHSPKFGKMMPLIDNVPGFSGIRIHPGNSIDDTSGCLLVGFGRDGSKLTQSASAYAELFDKISEAEQSGKSITIHFYTLEKRIATIGLIAALAVLLIVVVVNITKNQN
jgi:hypothetical protein